MPNSSTGMDSTPLRDAHGSTSDDDENPSPPSQRVRAAAQACETCRMRKVKCDEERPKCGVCRRLNTSCDYREAKPTKKDKTLVHILNSLLGVEEKLDRIYEAQQSLPAASAPSYILPPTSISRLSLPPYQLLGGIGTKPHVQLDSSYNSMSPQPVPAHGSVASTMGNSTSGLTPLTLPSGGSTPQSQQENRYHISARKLLTWPAIRQMLSEYNVEPQIMNDQWQPVEKWLKDISAGFTDDLSSGKPVRFVTGSQSYWDSDWIVVTLTMVDNYTSLFFSSFHTIYPILDEDYLRTHTIPIAIHGKFNQFDQNTTLILLVMALGEVAQQSVTGGPLIDHSTNRPTGVRGGSKAHPPGLSFVMEARSRIGQGMTHMDITVLHCYILFSLYYAQVSRNLDYWMMTRMASALCQSLIKCVDDWNCFEGDMLKRAYWMCVLLEGGLETELGLPLPGKNNFEPEFPSFMKAQCAQSNAFSDMDLAVKFTFMAQIQLRAQLNMINETVKPFDGSPSGVRDSFPSRAVTDALLLGLEHWRTAIPAEINWAEDKSPARSPPPSHRHLTPYSPLSPNQAAERHHLQDIHAFWSFSQPHPSINKIALPPGSSIFENMQIVLQAALRNRYKYAQYLIWRPYLYKVLHSSPNVTLSPSPPPHYNTRTAGKQPSNPLPFPDPAAVPHSQEIPITTDDVIGALNALNACTLWYITHPVFKDQRRLLPHLYEYSHTIFGILLLFKATERSGVMLAAFEAAERGPSASGFGQAAYPGGASSLSSPFGGPLVGASVERGLGGEGQANNIPAMQQALAQMGAAGQLEEYRFLREKMQISKECFLGWMRDMQVVHPIAAWCWNTLRKVYEL